MPWLAAIIGSIAGFLFGYDEGIIAGSLSLVKHFFDFSHTEVGTMAAALPFGALFGSMLIGLFSASYFAKYIARRQILFFAGLLFFCGALGTAYTSTAWLFIISRFLLGLAIGTAAVIAPLYLAETAPEKLRGAMVAMYQLAITIGIVCAYAINFLFVQYDAWRIMFASSALPAALLMIGALFLPESPRWLMSVGKEAEALQALKRLRKNDHFDKELEHIKTTLANEPKHHSWQTLFRKPLLPVLVLGMMLFCLQQLSGINVVIYYAPELFKNLGINSTSGQILATLGIGLGNLLVTLLAIAWVDKLGRRQLLLLGFAGACLSLGTLSLCSLSHFSWLAYAAIACLTFYIVSFAISIGPIPHIAMSEIFPLHVRGAGMALSSISNWGFNTLVVFSFPLLHHVFGIEYTLTLYALICFLGFLYTYHYLPETKKLSLEAIEDYVMSGHTLRYLGRHLDLYSRSKKQRLPSDESVINVFQD